MDGGNAVKVAGVTLSEFNPRLPWWGGDLQTIRNYAWSVDHALPSKAARRLVVRLKDGSGDRLVASLHLPEELRPRPLVLLIHGISGCETSCYMVLAAAYFLARGYPVLRINLRGAGPSRRFCRQQYHAGRTEDLAALLDRLDPKLMRHGVLPIGFSLGGNLLLKYLGETGRNGPVRRAATVSAPLDLAHSCRSLMRWRNYLYHRYILAHLKRNCTGHGAALTDAERKTILSAGSLWQLDDGFTAPRHGYTGAEDFYGANSSQHFLGGIKVPTLLIHAQDDPFVPADPYLEREWSSEPHLTPLLPKSGGHLGFHDPLGVWHLRQIEAFFEQA
jgi:predicted alpha/beta-fold hydrolase